uniref:Uncharacterized protein n=1 Tax=viral metagenome TaxID=1070528 RepID=A0A6M3K4Y7_9ZZZZ
MKNYYNLMEMSRDDLPPCIDDNEHDWEVKIRPSDCRSGLHEDKCIKCGIIIGYDTSD